MKLHPLKRRRNQGARREFPQSADARERLSGGRASVAPDTLAGCTLIVPQSNDSVWRRHASC